MHVPKFTSHAVLLWNQEIKSAIPESWPIKRFWIICLEFDGFCSAQALGTREPNASSHFGFFLRP
jgi:hypothetical protein